MLNNTLYIPKKSLSASREGSSTLCVPVNIPASRNHVMCTSTMILILTMTMTMIEDCPICYETLDNGEIRVTGCMHMFHRPCLRQWVKMKKKQYTRQVPCPMCRTILQKPPRVVQYSISYTISPTQGLRPRTPTPSAGPAHFTTPPNLS